MTGFWEANLGALARRDDRGSRHLASSLTPGGPAPDLGLRSRGGQILPGLTGEGTPRSLVSTFDPVREADRWTEGWAGGTAVVFGAAGVQAARALSDRGATLMFWVEPRLEPWRSLLTWEDWTPWLSRSDWVPVAGPPSDLESLVQDRYHPLWDGALRSFDWRAAATEEDPWVNHRRAVLRALDSVGADTSTQARFGERWYRNTLVNLKNLMPGSIPGCPGARVVVAGAGPSLGDALEKSENLRWLEARPRHGGRLFSTDTALPALTSRNIVPDLVLCLDGQLPTYHHFLMERPQGAFLASELASIPLLGRLGMPGVRYLSGHPFGAVIRRHFPDLPTLDGSHGHVSGLALRTAQALGAREVVTWGVDFSYRDGQAYARGTYVYDLAARGAGRLDPMETRLARGCYGLAGRERTRDGQGRALDTTPLLRSYKIRWDTPEPPAEPTLLAHGASGPRWEAFLDDWRARLADLPLPRRGTPVHGFVRDLPVDRRQDWLALWPLALSIHRREGRLDPRTMVERALALIPGR